ncbi:hypothetical protein B6U74_07535 [Candidatus Bathyarchaeota archaeon ex4484_205]|nr:MAG: hypothetical protein B6U74_07535 [Candidatus Bathyarchaeota archaeon ex4484_205]
MFFTLSTQLEHMSGSVIRVPSKKLAVISSLMEVIPGKSICVKCKGTKLLCGKRECPILVKISSYFKHASSKRNIEGASPPSVFIGSRSMRVSIQVPNEKFGDTSVYSNPEGRWIHMDLKEIVDMRYELIGGYPEKIEKTIDEIREINLSKKSVDVEMTLKRAPRSKIELSDEIQPIGPSAPLLEIDYSQRGSNRSVEKVYYEEDMPAIEEIRIHEFNALGNRFLIIMFPGAWKYESMEAWYPGTTWNPFGKRTYVLSDWEPFSGRSTYAQIGGCYYAARLAVLEKLVSEKRQASVLILREAYPEYLMPLGVWLVRESVREALSREAVKLEEVKDLLNFLRYKLRIPPEEWMKNGILLREILQQKRITDFF